jgi:three-Cys-motif partner protein
MNTTADASYWPDYSNLQAVKHALIRRYLGGWFPKLGSWAGRVLYVDTHAGRGRHLTGDLGSPLIALRTLLDHHYRDALLRRCEFQFHLIERDEENFEALRAELREFGPLPRNVVVIPRLADAFAHLSSLLDDLRRNGQQLAPAFVFVDPYGFKIPGALLRQVMRAGRVELFVNVIWRELGMALSQKDLAPGTATTLTEIFDGEEWRGLAAVGFEEKADRAIDLLKLKLEAHWSTPIRMLGDNDTTRYVLVHFSNHVEGRDLMKEAIWSVCPTGGFFARRSDDPAQQVLITPKPNLKPLRDILIAALREAPRRWSELHDIVRPLVWRDTHVNTVVSELRNEGLVVPPGYTGRFSPKANPTPTLAEAAGAPSSKGRNKNA